MFIVSDFQDYYDVMAYAYGIDKSLTFTRKSSFRQVIDLNAIFNPSLKNVVNHFVQAHKYSGDKTYHRHLLITPNKIHRVLQWYKWGIGKNGAPCDNSEYTMDYAPNDEIGRYLMKQYLADLESNEQYIREVFYNTVNLPYFMISRINGSLEATIPILREINFNTIMDADECFQMVEMKLSQQQGNHDDKLIVIKDSDRITQHGFDSKSFRHRK